MAFEGTWMYSLYHSLLIEPSESNVLQLLQPFLNMKAAHKVAIPHSLKQLNIGSTTRYLIFPTCRWFSIFTSGPSIPTLRQQIHSAISLTSSWATNHGFLSSTSKSFSILFSRSCVGPQPPLSLFDAPLHFRSSGKMTPYFPVKTTSSTSKRKPIISDSCRSSLTYPGVQIAKPYSISILHWLSPLLTMTIIATLPLPLF